MRLYITWNLKRYPNFKERKDIIIDNHMIYEKDL